MTVVTFLDGHSKSMKLENLMQRNAAGIRPMWTVEED